MTTAESIRHPFGDNEKVSRKNFHYTDTYTATPEPEKVAADYREAYETVEKLHARLKLIAQGQTYFNSYDEITWWSSKDDLNVTVENYGKAVLNLYDQDSAAKRYVDVNLDVLIEQARFEMETDFFLRDLERTPES